jgi:hypothetical protein
MTYVWHLGYIMRDISEIYMEQTSCHAIERSSYLVKKKRPREKLRPVLNMSLPPRGVLGPYGVNFDP